MEIVISSSCRHKIIGVATPRSVKKYQWFVMHKMWYCSNIEVYPTLYKTM